MGFEHYFKTDAGVAARGKIALEELCDWGRQAGYELDDLVPDALVDSPDYVLTWDSETREPYMTLEGDERPGPGEATLWWFEIPWLRKLPSVVMDRMYRLLEAHAALPVWASIIGDGTAKADSMATVYPKLLDAIGGGELKQVGRYSSEDSDPQDSA